MKSEIITLGAGCFWCVENIFSRIRGVISVVSGYADGDVEQPSYEEVCSESTNHAEVVQITFDPEVISFDEILTVFFAIHDPTTLNRQGADVGTQYRSTVLYNNVEQKNAALNKIKALNNSEIFEQKIVTSVVAEKNFYAAENYHQNYYNNNSENQYCQLVVAQKIQKFLSEFSHLLKDD